MGMDYHFNQVGFTFSGFFWLMECQEMNRFQRFWIKSYGIGKWILAGYTLGLVNIILCLPLLCTGYHYHILVWKNPDRQVKRKTKMSHSYIMQYLIVVFANRISRPEVENIFFGKIMKRQTVGFQWSTNFMTINHIYFCLNVTLESIILISIEIWSLAQCLLESILMC